MSYHPKQEPSSPDAEPKEKESRKLFRRQTEKEGGSGPEGSPEDAKQWLGVWTLRPSDVADCCPAARSLEEKGYRLISHCAPFGTILQYQKGSDWKFVIPAKPRVVMSRKESLEFIREQWNLRRPEHQKYWEEKILLPLSKL